MASIADSIEMDPDTGSVTSILDKESDRELVDHSAQHGFGDFVVRDPHMATCDDLDDVRVSVEHTGDVDDAGAVRFGWDAVTPLEAILTQAGSGALPPVSSYLEIDDPNLVLLAWKQAEDGDGWIIRLWNTADTPSTSTIRMPGLRLTEVRPVSLVEDPLPGTTDLTADAFKVEIAPCSVQTYRCSGAPESLA